MSDEKQQVLAVRTEQLPAAGLNFADERILATMRNTVATGATDAEFAMFVEFAKSTGLNPFKRELWFIKSTGRVQMMTGLNGFLAIANNNPMFDGMEVEVDDDDNPKKAICKVFRKDRSHPAVGVAMMKEYRKDSPVWRQMPRVMLTKVAKSIALREAFPQQLNGLYTEEEMPPSYVSPPDVAAPQEKAIPVKVKVVAPPDTPVPDANAEMQKACKDLAMKLNAAWGKTPAAQAKVVAMIQRVTGAKRIADVPADKLPALLAELRKATTPQDEQPAPAEPASDADITTSWTAFTEAYEMAARDNNIAPSVASKALAAALKAAKCDDVPENTLAEWRMGILSAISDGRFDWSTGKVASEQT